MNKRAGIHMSESAVKKLMKKSDKHMAGEQYPEAADQLIKLMDRCDKLEKRVAKAEKRLKVLEGMHYGHIKVHVEKGCPV